MSPFEHVSVLLSIVVALAIAHILQGAGDLITQRHSGESPVRLSLAQAAWSTYVLLYVALVWYWEYQLDTVVSEWSLGLYFFVLGYAVTLFFLAVLVMPRSWEDIQDLHEHFVGKRYWFFSAFVVAGGFDALDMYLKGLYDGRSALVAPVAWIVVALIGVLSTSRRVHNVLAVLCLAGLLLSLQAYPTFTR